MVEGTHKHCNYCQKDISHLRSNARFCSNNNRCKASFNRNKKNSKSGCKSLNPTKGNLPYSVTVSKICTLEYCTNIVKPKCKKCSDCIEKSKVDWLGRLTWSAYGKWLVQTLREQKTVETCQNSKGSPNTVEDWNDLLKVKTSCSQANGSGTDKATPSNRYEKCHLTPASKLGIFHASNFILANAILNKKLGTNDFGFNLSIGNPDPKWSTTDLSDYEIIQLVNEYTNGSLLEWQNKNKQKQQKGNNGAFNVEPLDTHSVVIGEIQRLAKYHPVFTLYLKPEKKAGVIYSRFREGTAIGDVLPRILQNRLPPVKFNFTVNLVKRDGTEIPAITGIMKPPHQEQHITI